MVESFWFVLSKVIMPWFSPVFLFLLASIILIIRASKGTPQRRSRFFLLALWAVAFLASCPLVSELLIRAWELPPPLEGPIAKNFPAEAWDLVVVLGGGTDPTWSAGWQISVNASADRLESAARLYHEGRVKRILVSGGNGDPGAQDKPEAPLMQRLLVGMGVADSAIVLESKSRNTFENAVYIRDILAQSGDNRVLLITSALHMRRSQAIFRKAGFEWDILPVDTLSKPLILPDCLVPDAQAVVNLGRVLHEMTGFVVYRLLGRL